MKNRVIDRATVTMKELFGNVRGRDYLRFGGSVLPHSRTPLWSYTPRCICSWFSEGRGMGQRVIFLEKKKKKTIKGNLSERETARQRRVGGAKAIQRGEGEKKQTRTDKISRDRSRIGERGRQLEEPDDRPSELTHVPTVAAALLLLLLRLGGLMLALY